MSACPEYEELVALHAAGALEPGDEARVRAHLESCAACRSELASTSRVLSEVALPAPAPAMRERMEALPRRALSAWRREQVRRAFRARTVGALLAAAAGVLLVVRPSLQLPGTPHAPAPLPVAPRALSETQSDFEQWASTDPLGEEIDPAGAGEGLEDWEDEAEGAPSASELFLNLNDGETP